MEEGKTYFSQKHRLYAIKIEIVTRSNIMASTFNGHYLGSLSDMSILNEVVSIHLAQLEKTNDNNQFVDSHLLHKKYPDYLAALVDKCYH